MSEPQHLNTGDWLGIGGLAATVIGSVVGGVKGMLGKRDERITALENGHKSLENGHHDQTTQLAELRVCQQNTSEHLKLIRESAKDTNAKLDVLIEASLNRMPGGKRRTDE